MAKNMREWSTDHGEPIGQSMEDLEHEIYNETFGRKCPECTRFIPDIEWDEDYGMCVHCSEGEEWQQKSIEDQIDWGGE